jgi:KaiC/GvpD/RAD55 family RecA-like ATPase
VSEDRVPTGIEGFDDLIEGGVPRGSLVLLAGDAGSGKTISHNHPAERVNKSARVFAQSLEEGF